MGARTTGREAALQMIFALEANGNSAEQVINQFWRETPGDPEGREYAERVVRGVAADLEKVDSTIRKASTNWRIEAHGPRRSQRAPPRHVGARADRRRPRAVILDEAVELAKRFGSEDSGSFVNGVLDRIATDLGRVDRDR